jgi:hypothetical protein
MLAEIGLENSFGDLMKSTALLLLAGLSTAHAAEPTGKLTLACKGTETDRGGAGMSSGQIDIGVIVDFQNNTIILPDTSLTITSVSETSVSFMGGGTDWNMNGTLDRVTGSLVAASIKFYPNTTKTIFAASYDLQCKPTQRMF